MSRISQMIAAGAEPSKGETKQLINNSDEVVRYLVVSTTASADLVEYPDSNKIAAMGGGIGTPGSASYMLSTADQLGYFDGETDEEPTR